MLALDGHSAVLIFFHIVAPTVNFIVRGYCCLSQLLLLFPIILWQFTCFATAIAVELWDSFRKCGARPLFPWHEFLLLFLPIYEWIQSEQKDYSIWNRIFSRCSSAWKTVNIFWVAFDTFSASGHIQSWNHYVDTLTVVEIVSKEIHFVAPYLAWIQDWLEAS